MGAEIALKPVADGEVSSVDQGLTPTLQAPHRVQGEHTSEMAPTTTDGVVVERSSLL
jgi:hypothetical protein